MATEAQIRANQQNARHSTGPNTEPGKARSAQNARIHGFCAQSLAFSTVEDREAFLDRCLEISGQYRFEHALKESLVTAVASAEYQIYLINIAKKGVLRALTANAVQRPDESELDRLAAAFGNALLTRPEGRDSLDKLNRYEVEQRRLFYRALNELERLNREYQPETKPIPTEKKPFPPEKKQPERWRNTAPEVKSSPPNPKAA